MVYVTTPYSSSASAGSTKHTEGKDATVAEDGALSPDTPEAAPAAAPAPASPPPDTPPTDPPAGYLSSFRRKSF